MPIELSTLIHRLLKAPNEQAQNTAITLWLFHVLTQCITHNRTLGVSNVLSPSTLCDRLEEALSEPLPTTITLHQLKQLKAKLSGWQLTQNQTDNPYDPSSEKLIHALKDRLFTILMSKMAPKELDIACFYQENPNKINRAFIKKVSTQLDNLNPQTTHDKIQNTAQLLQTLQQLEANQDQYGKMLRNIAFNHYESSANRHAEPPIKTQEDVIPTTLTNNSAMADPRSPRLMALSNITNPTPENIAEQRQLIAEQPLSTQDLLLAVHDHWISAARMMSSPLIRYHIAHTEIQLLITILNTYAFESTLEEQLTEIAQHHQQSLEALEAQTLQLQQILKSFISNYRITSSLIARLQRNTNDKIDTILTKNPSNWARTETQLLIRPLQKLAEENELRRDVARRTGVHRLVHEDSSAASMKQGTSSVEFAKRSLESINAIGASTNIDPKNPLESLVILHEKIMHINKELDWIAMIEAYNHALNPTSSMNALTDVIAYVTIKEAFKMALAKLPETCQRKTSARRVLCDVENLIAQHTTSKKPLFSINTLTKTLNAVYPLLHQNPLATDFKPCIKQIRQLQQTVNSDTHSLCKLLCLTMGIALIAASVALLAVSFGASTPLSAVGVVIGAKLAITASLVHSLTFGGLVGGIGALCTGIGLFKQLKKKPARTTENQLIDGLTTLNLNGQTQ